ncbi:hypothetical protein [Nisaea sp.]|uniref:hypothetical protein n=1 Tax=Nisaea sp. TaxID=2024842 RepID=UPI0032641D55
MEVRKFFFGFGWYETTPVRVAIEIPDEPGNKAIMGYILFMTTTDWDRLRPAVDDD